MAYYDPVRKKGRKKTGKYLGRITEDQGLIAPTHKRAPKSYLPVNPLSVSTKDYGLWAFIQNNCQDMMDGLTQFSPCNGMDNDRPLLQISTYLIGEEHELLL